MNAVMKPLADLVAQLDQAQQTASATAQLSGEGRELSLKDAYAIQEQLIGKRLARGERIVGVKMGFTSRAKMIQMGVHDLIWGRLTSGMLREEGAPVSVRSFIHPRIEPEVAFRLKRPLSGIVSLLEAQSAVEAIAPAMEIIDSRYKDFKFSLADVVADNCSSAGVVIGAWRGVPGDISNLGMVMSFNGVPVQIGSSAGILGHPLRALVSAARLAGEQGVVLEPGWIVMAGAATAAEALKADLHVMLEAEQLGTVEITTTANM